MTPDEIAATARVLPRTRAPHPLSVSAATALVAHLNAEAALRAQGSDGRRLDADETNMLALALEDLRTRVYEADYPVLKARTLISVASDIDNGAESFAYEETDEAGEAKVITNWSDPLPGVETKGQKQTRAILSIGVGYSYSVQDMRRAAFSGRPLEARKAIAARRAFDRKVDKLASVGGEPSHGISKGICNQTLGTTSGTIRYTAMTATAWDSTPVAADMLTDLNKLVAEYVVDAKELNASSLTLAMPTIHYLRAQHTMFSDGSPESVAQRFLKVNGFVSQLVPWNALLGVAGTGASDTAPNGGDESRFLLMAKSPDVAEIVIPQDFEIFGPQPLNLAFQVACHGRIAGTCIYRPLGLRYGTGIGIA